MIDFKNLPCSIQPAIITPLDAIYWKVVHAVALPPSESHGIHNIYVRCFNENNQRMSGVPVDLFWPGGQHSGKTEIKPEGEWGDINFPMYGDWKPEEGPGPYSISIGDRRPSEVVAGMGLPRKQHYSFVIFYKLLPVEAPTVETFDQMFLRLGQANQAIRLNPGASLQRAILDAGFVPTSKEFSATWENVVWVAQRAEQLRTGEVRVYRCPVGQYDQISYVTR